MRTSMNDAIMSAILQSLSPIQHVHESPHAPDLLPVLDLDKSMKSSKSNKCSAACCKKKLHLSDFDCGKCKTRFCNQHRLPEAHACPHDFKKEGAALLTAQNPKVVGSTLDRI